MLQFLKEKQMNLFITPPDTTGVTQLLDQINQSLHTSYREHKNILFFPECTINHEGFMNILDKIWTEWKTADAIVRAAKRVGVSAH